MKKIMQILAFSTSVATVVFAIATAVFTSIQLAQQDK